MTRVLLVDDDPDYRLLVRLALAGHPLLEVVGEAGNGAEAAAAAAHHRPDLVLLDCSMPGADAFDGLPGLRRACPDCAVILLSSHDPDDLRTAAWSAGALGFLSKETPPSRLPEDVIALAGLLGAVEAVLHHASTSLDASTSSPGAARRFVTEALTPFVPEPLLGTVVLLTSELVTNAVVHAGSEVEMLVQLTERVARVEVSDRSDLPPASRPHQEGISGRGLLLVESLALHWGAYRRAGGGKTTWFEVAREGGAEPSGAPASA